jgi:ribosomal protein S18 acetylase RimI-like enzyme
LLPLLLEADGSEAVVRAYLDDGVLLAIVEGDDEVGVALVVPVVEDLGARELKNLAVSAPHRRRGVGTRTVALLADRLRDEGVTRLIVGTAETSTDALRFYRRCGFRVRGRRAGYFDAYLEPVVEGGVVAHDMVMLEMDLDPGR